MNKLKSIYNSTKRIFNSSKVSVIKLFSNIWRGTTKINDKLFKLIITAISSVITVAIILPIILVAGLASTKVTGDVYEQYN